MRRYLLLLSAILATLMFACNTGRKSPSGFRLPDGDVEKGKAAFVELKCNNCHTVEGLQLPSIAEPLMSLMLGGEVHVVRTDGELVTSVINPSHRLAPGFPKELIQVNGKSRMPDYGDVMTVRQMIDLVAFLHAHYKYVPPKHYK